MFFVWAIHNITKVRFMAFIFHRLKICGIWEDFRKFRKMLFGLYFVKPWNYNTLISKGLIFTWIKLPRLMRFFQIRTTYILQKLFVLWNLKCKFQEWFTYSSVIYMQLSADNHYFYLNHIYGSIILDSSVHLHLSKIIGESVGIGCLLF